MQLLRVLVLQVLLLRLKVLGLLVLEVLGLRLQLLRVLVVLDVLNRPPPHNLPPPPH